ncbi:hypothetical protein QQS21_009195 [Conoideocrella luteorostrata]|uniref:Uncharacterized protein n=1 Tax=Conoideocrella luteorostrata TaxID=1105319 RepID=A0AAJ0CHD8_9HYPO|nr:hypothetical protein QQS21_009195 [Conoideocrella luteorostrata]
MKFLNTLAIFVALSLPALATPIESQDAISLEERTHFVTCKPKLNGKEKHFKVDLAFAQRQAEKAGKIPFGKGYETPKSGFPSRYHKGDHIRWGVHGCDTKSLQYQYPIYWDGKNNKWESDVAADKQKGGHTPLRVVFCKLGDSKKYLRFCGVMTYTEVNDKNEGSGAFVKCN